MHCALTDLPSVEVLESGTQWAIDVVVLSSKPVLPLVTQRIELIAPVAVEIKPLRWRSGVLDGRAEGVAQIIVRVSVRVQHRIPEWAPIRLVMEESPRQNIFVYPRRGIHRMGANGRVYHRLGCTVSALVHSSFRLGWQLTRFPIFSTAS